MTRSPESAAILLFRRTSQGLEVFLVHPGGPYFARKDAGAWSLPKGEAETSADLLETAIREFAEDPQAKHNRTIFDAEHPEAGTMRYVRYPGHLSETPACLYRHPPRLGEHSREILKEAGYADEQIERLLREHVVGG